jgi:hypothetical protein
MDQSNPSFEDYRRRAEAKLGSSIGGNCRITVVHEMNEDLLRIIKEIENERFRRELRYTKRELRKRSRLPGFVCLMVYVDERPVAFVFGYDDSEEGAYFSDSSATLIERKGVGSTLSALEVLYCFEKGYRKSKMITEEVDESGRRLREYWERFGLKVTGFDPEAGVLMGVDLTPENVSAICRKHIGG